MTQCFSLSEVPNGHIRSQYIISTSLGVFHIPEVPEGENRVVFSNKPWTDYLTNVVMTDTPFGRAARNDMLRKPRMKPQPVTITSTRELIEGKGTHSFYRYENEPADYMTLVRDAASYTSPYPILSTESERTHVSWNLRKHIRRQAYSHSSYHYMLHPLSAPSIMYETVARIDQTLFLATTASLNTMTNSAFRSKHSQDYNYNFLEPFEHGDLVTFLFHHPVKDVDPEMLRYFLLLTGFFICDSLRVDDPWDQIVDLLSSRLGSHTAAILSAFGSYKEPAA